MPEFGVSKAKDRKRPAFNLPVLREQAAPGLQSSYEETANISPSVARSWDVISESLGVTREEASTFSDNVRNRFVKQIENPPPDFERMERDYPMSSKFLGNPLYMTTWHENIGELNAVEGLIHQGTRGLERGQTTIGIGNIGKLARDQGGVLTKEQKRQLDNFRILASREDNAPWWDLPKRMLSASGEFLPLMYRGIEAGTALGTATGGAFALAGGSLGGPVGAVAAGTVGFKGGFIAGMFRYMAEIEGGASYLEMIEAGVPHHIADSTSHIVGGIAAALEYAQLSILGAPMARAGKFLFKKTLQKRIIAKLAEKEALTGISAYGRKQAAVSFGKQIASITALETVIEMSQEAVGVTGGWAGKTIARSTGADVEWWDFSELTEAMGEAAKLTVYGTPLIAGPGVSVNVIAQQRQANQYKLYKEALKETAESGSFGAIFKANPRGARSFIAQAVEAGNMPSTMVIDSGNLLDVFVEDGKGLEAFFQATGVTKEQLQESLEADGSGQIEVSVEKLVNLAQDKNTSGKWELLMGDKGFSFDFIQDISEQEAETKAKDTTIEQQEQGAEAEVTAEDEQVRQIEPQETEKISVLKVLQDVLFQEPPPYYPYLKQVKDKVLEIEKALKKIPRGYANAFVGLVEAFALRQAEEPGGMAPELWIQKYLGDIDLEKSFEGFARGNGLSLADVKETPKGVTIFDDANRAMIRLFSGADPSTAFHEVFHAMRRDLEGRASSLEANEQVKKDWTAVLEWLGAQEGKPLTREQEERFADAGVLYLAEGKSPTPALRKVFARIKRWLLSAYKALLANPDIMLTDDIRGVFDRLLANSEEIEASRKAAGLEALFPLENSFYQELFQMAVDAAAAKMSQGFAPVIGEKARQWQKEAQQEVETHPDTVFLNNVVEAGGFNREAAQREYTPDIIEYLDALNPGLLQDGAFLFLSQEDASNLIEMKTKDELIKQLVAEKEAAWQSAPMGDEAAFTKEFEALLQYEIEQLAKESGVDNILTRQEVRWMVRNKLAEMTVEDILNVNRTLKNGIKRAQVTAKESFSLGKKKGALAEKQKQQARLIRYREQVKARAEIGKILKRAKKFSKKNPKTIEWAYREQIRALASHFGLVGKSLGPIQPEALTSLQEFLSNALSDSIIKESDMIAPWLLDTKLPVKTWRELTLDELRDINNVLEILHALGSNEKTLFKNERTKSYEDAKAEIIKTALEKGKKPAPEKTVMPSERKGVLGVAKEQANKYLAALEAPEFIFRNLDGLVEMGPIWQHFFQPFVRAEDAKLKMWEKYTPMLQEAFAPFEKQLRGWATTKIAIPEISQHYLTMEQIICVALNTGNEGNLYALMKGYNWNEQQLAAILENLDENHWKLVRNLWDIIGWLWEPLDEVTYRLTGARPKKVDGNYYPIHPDRLATGETNQITKEKASEDFFQNIIHRATTKNQMVKTRRGATYPPLLRFDVVYRHIEDSIQYITHAEAVRDVQKLTLDADIRRAIVNQIGQEYYDQIMPWIEFIARPETDFSNALDKAANWIKKNTTLAALGLKFTVALVQPLAYTQTINELGEVTAAKGMMLFASNPFFWSSFVKEKSSAMRARYKSMDREILDIYNQMRPDELKVLGYGKQELSEAFFSLIALMDASAAIPTWLSAYNKGKKEGMTEQKAVDFADGIVRRTQPVAMPKDLAAIQRGTPLQKLFVMFYTFFRSFLNVFKEKHRGWAKGQISIGQLMKSYWWLVIVPAQAGALMQGLPDDDKDEDWFSWFMKNNLKYVAAGFPIIRDVAGIVDIAFSGRPYNYRLSPVAGAGEGLYRTGSAGVKLATDDGEWWSFIKPLVSTSGYFTGLPTQQAVTTMQGILDMQEEGVTPETLWHLGFPKKRD